MARVVPGVGPLVPVVGSLVSMVKEKVSSDLLKQYQVMWGMKKQHNLLKHKLQAILDVIIDAENLATDDREGVKDWLDSVQNVAYQASHVFDKFSYEALRRKAKKEGHYREQGMHVKFFPTHNHIVFRYKMGNELKMILKAIDVLIVGMNAFRLHSTILDTMEIASRSREREKREVIDILLGQGSRVDLTVLPIVGMEGIGKTTLTQLVYDDFQIKEHFQLRLWVCATGNFDVDFLAESIVEAAARPVERGTPPLENIRKVVSGKRYLLVLDDVWNRDASQWEKLKSCLQYGGMGSSVVATTRDEAIAQLMGPTEVYKLGLLDKSFIEEIIMKKAFSLVVVSPANEVVEMVSDMAKRCAGFPLAAQTLGSILRTRTSIEEWKAVLRNSIIGDYETGTYATLIKGYNDLPSEMRQCFSFCAMFPEDYDIDVEMLIQLWMANGFIQEEQGVCQEIRGKRIFNELVSRSFFHGVTEIPFGYKSVLGSSKFRHCSRIRCQIHDLMHNIARYAMGKECANITVKPSENEDFPYSTRHLFVPLDDPGTILNGFLEERSPALQTLVCTGGGSEELQYLSKHNSIRALRIQMHSPLRPKYLHLLRYLDLSESSIEALPEDISILYYLQTLNLSGCWRLAQLPKEMKYMTALRHLYTNGCPELKTMPPELRCLASLRTLTCFVAGNDSSCSDMGELGLLDLGGYLEVRQLENVAETDALAANLENKKKLDELSFEWTHPSSEPQHHHHVVLNALKPHDQIKAVTISCYGGSTYPTWINTLRHVVELVLSDCSNLEKLPPFWQLPNLQVLYMSGMKNLRCLWGGDPPFKFSKLKELCLYEMPNLETWWDINEVQEQDQKLAALPRASVITELSEKVNTGWRSTCPALMELELYNLTSFQRWEAVEGTVGEQITTFPWLEKLSIRGCPELTTTPEAPKLSVLKIERSRQQIFLNSARYTSLSTLEISKCDALVHWPEDVFQHLLSLRELIIGRCKKLTGCTQASEQSMPGQSVLPPCLESLALSSCDSLVEVPVLPASLRKLYIDWCEKLGSVVLRKQQNTRQEKSASSSNDSPGTSVCYSVPEVPITDLHIVDCSYLETLSVRLDCTKLFIGYCTRLKSLDGDLLSLEHLYLYGCDSLEHIPDGPHAYASLRYLRIRGCPGLKGSSSVPTALYLNDIENKYLDADT